MKLIFVMIVTLFSIHCFAGEWTEFVECKILKESVNSQNLESSSVEISFQMKGPHNGEKGQGLVSHILLPKYDVVFNKFSGGRTDEIELLTKNGSLLMAKSSVYGDQEVTNRFLTLDGSFQVTVVCSSKIPLEK